MPTPVVENDNLDLPYWEGTLKGELRVQRCKNCGTWQWGPEWMCHECLAFDPDWVEVAPQGKVYSWTRLWHPVHPALKQHGPYLAVLVELPHAGNIRMLGNLIGDPKQEVKIGDEVEAVFEQHPDGNPPYALVHWKRK
ncbi:MAG: OB-fold domain-containing protein [Hoeflea sp.]|jgi:uncharacterized OB-fold protein|nr:OB-fold domain-containing protein [Hoeflea sp.]